MARQNYCLNSILKDLDKTGSRFRQRKAIKKLTRIREEELHLLIHPRPYSNKSCWENAALVLQELGYPKIEKEIVKLLEWVMDMNWPGAEKIFDLLKTVPSNVLVENVEHLIYNNAEPSSLSEDYMWISKLIIESEINEEDFKNAKYYRELNEIYTNNIFNKR